MIRDCFGIAGLVAIVAGVDMLSRPAAVIMAGIALVICALFAPERKKKTGN